MRKCTRTLIIVLISLVPSAASWAQTITVNASAPVRTIPMSMYGGNLFAWDGAQAGTNPTYNALLKASGRKIQRIIGGSWSNGHLWSDIEELNSPYGSATWKVSYQEFLNLLSAISEPGEEMPPSFQPIVNFPGYWYKDVNGNDIAHGHQAAVDAAVAWVQDQSARPVTAQFWEIGNEVFGPWEVGHFPQISGTYYGDYYADFHLGMKAANPNIKVGAVAFETHELNPWGWYQGYWTYDTLRAAFAKGVVPDFLIIHQYPGSGQGASYNPTLLGTDVNNIGVFTSNLNGIVTNAIGSQYVGQVKYAMTEWDAGATDTYARTRAYVNAMFHTQYILEMCKNNWEISNAWTPAEYDSSNFRVFPVWYMHPLLINYFGRDMVQASSSDSSVRAYAAKDAATGDLTLFMVNNSPTSSKTATINISGFSPATVGHRWLIAPAGAMIAGGVNIQDNADISINGVVNPNALTSPSLPSQSVATGNTFSVTLPASNMMMLRIPSTAGDLTPPAAPSGLTATPGYRTVALNWNDVSASDLKLYRVYRTTTPGGQISPVALTTSSEYTDNDVNNGTTYYYTVTAVDKSWNESADSAEVSAIPQAPPQGPYGGTPWAIPGVIEGENFDLGLEGVAYHDVDAGNAGGQYRTSEDVDVESCSEGGFNVGWVSNGEWLEYTVNVAATGSYDVAVRAASTVSTGRFTIQFDGVPVTGLLSVPNTGGWQTWTNVTASGVVLTAGQHVMRIQMDAGSWNLNKITFSSGAITTPAAPSSLAATAVSTSQINLTWADNSSNESNFELQRATDSTFTANLVTTTLGANVTSASATGLADSTTYYFRVRATNVAGASAYSNTASATTQTPPDTTPPAAPTGLVAAGVSSSQINLDWADNSESDLAGYNVYRSMTSGGPYTKVNGSPLTSSAFNNTGLSPATTYHYVVTAVDAAGNESAQSSQASASTQAPVATVHVTLVDTLIVGIGKGKKAGQATVTVRDASGNPVANVTVTGTFSGALNETRTGVTNSSGVAVIQTAGTVSNKAGLCFCVTNLTHATLTYDPSANTDRCDFGGSGSSSACVD